ncbi:MAG: hypothetical protein A3H32_20985 [Betaproteobacteria bacterium RIFCSPLOWO2_02_FULL_63_19]|nr:MAG: hypothetical protein A3H32_20985 [Betaproteobacteria bacterium RIFCSPLOWO2_02_FULL_63_19]
MQIVRRNDPADQADGQRAPCIERIGSTLSPPHGMFPIDLYPSAIRRIRACLNFVGRHATLALGHVARAGQTRTATLKHQSHR